MYNFCLAVVFHGKEVDMLEVTSASFKALLAVLDSKVAITKFMDGQRNESRLKVRIKIEETLISINIFDQQQLLELTGTLLTNNFFTSRQWHAHN